MRVLGLILIVILFVLLGFFVETTRENFMTLTKSADGYQCDSETKLCPVKGLDPFCRKKGLEPAYMPQTCFRKDGTFDYYKNCICLDEDGFCEICYPHSEKLAEEELDATLINTIPVESDDIATSYTTSVETR